MKILFNDSYGDSLHSAFSEKAMNMYCQKTGLKNFLEAGDVRVDPIMIDIVETLREEASDNYSKICIAEIPDNAYWRVEEYDGHERIFYTLTPPPTEYEAKVLTIYK